MRLSDLVARARLELGFGPKLALVEAWATVEAGANGDRATVHVGRTGAHRLEALDGTFTHVSLDASLLVSRLRRDDRVALLRACARRLSAEGRLSLGLRIAMEAVRGRILLDAPRARLSALRVPEPGSRFFPGGPTHLYFAHDELLAEAEESGLGLESWENATFVFRPGVVPRAKVSARAGIPHLIKAVIEADVLRRASPREALARARARGEREVARTREERLALRESLALVEALVPPRANCFRRVLAEIVLDRGAAQDTVVFSLDLASDGHAHFRGDPNGPPRRYDVSFEA
jgi:hypothetical protein